MPVGPELDLLPLFTLQGPLAWGVAYTGQEAPHPGIAPPGQAYPGPRAFAQLSSVYVQAHSLLPSKFLLRCHCYGPDICVPHIPR